MKKRINMQKRIVITMANILFGLSLFAQTNIPASFKPSLRLNFPMIDASHWQNAAFTSANFNKPNSDGKPNFGDWSFSILKNPSMYQATEWNQDAVKTLAWSSQIISNQIFTPNTFLKKTANILIGQLLTGSSTYILGGFPLGEGWLHEEYHRAMLATNRVASKDPFDDYKLDLNDGSVKNIYDNALRKFKKNDPYAFNRMLIAGSEGDLYAVRRLQEDNFFYNANLPIELVSIIYTTAATSYMNSTYTDIDSMNIPLNREDGANILARDFTGHDYSGWICHYLNLMFPTTH
jgi:hypothetical protein